MKQDGTTGGQIMRTTLCALVAVLMAGGGTTAHEQSLHKGHPTEGRVASVSENGFVLDTDKGNVSVTLTDTTTMARGEKPITRKDIRPGDHVSVLGTKLATGELVAHEIVVQTPSHEDHESGTGHDGQ